MLILNNDFEQPYSFDISLSESTSRNSLQNWDISKDLRLVTPKVHEICKITGIVGLSAAVVYQSEIIWSENNGYRNLDKKLPVTLDTAFPIGALSQGFTAACITQLKCDGRLNYEDKISEHLGKPTCQNHVTSDDITISDLLGHRTGLEAADSLFLTNGGHIVLDKVNLTNIFCQLNRQASPRSQFIHSTINYALLEKIIARRRPEGYQKYLQTNVFMPLRIHLSNFDTWSPIPKDESPLYRVLRNGQPHQSRFRTHESNALPNSATYPSGGYARGGMTRSVHNLIAYCRGLNIAASESHDHITESYVSSRVFPDVDTLFKPLQAMGESTPKGNAKTNYAAGWATCTLPGSLAGLGINSKLVNVPPVAAGSDEVTVYWNQGMQHGANSFVAVLPKYKAAVIVLTNTTTANDAADWIGQLLLQTLLNSPLRNNYSFLAQVTVDSAHQRHEEIVEKVEKGRQSWCPKLCLGRFEGLYRSNSGSFYLTIGMKDGGLTVTFPTGALEGLALQHHHGDSFTWSPDWDDMVKGEMPMRDHPEYHFLHFYRSKHGCKIVALIWAHDPEIPEGELYVCEERVRTYGLAPTCPLRMRE
ncbi:hypothetical protein ACHAQJ_005097 [Trichoderma viride]